jgi:hypothetical protein
MGVANEWTTFARERLHHHDPVAWPLDKKGVTQELPLTHASPGLDLTP